MTSLWLRIVALSRVIEARARTSPRVQRRARRLMAALAKRSREARSFVQLRLMRLV
jgi:hypothetical protein